MGSEFQPLRFRHSYAETHQIPIIPIAVEISFVNNKSVIYSLNLCQIKKMLNILIIGI